MKKKVWIVSVVFLVLYAGITLCNIFPYRHYFAAPKVLLLTILPLLLDIAASVLLTVSLISKKDILMTAGSAGAILGKLISLGYQLASIVAISNPKAGILSQEEFEGIKKQLLK